jgi:hypothetical protein
MHGGYTVILEGPFTPHRAILAFLNRGCFGSNPGAKTEHKGRFGPYFYSCFGHVKGQIGMLI